MPQRPFHQLVFLALVLTHHGEESIQVFLQRRRFGGVAAAGDRARTFERLAQTRVLRADAADVADNFANDGCLPSECAQQEPSAGLHGDGRRTAGCLRGPVGQAAKGACGFGGDQFGARTFGGKGYPAGGFVDMVLEAFGGVHDTVDSLLFYDRAAGTASETVYNSAFLMKTFDLWSAVTLPFEAPFAAASILQEFKLGTALPAINQVR